MAKSRKPPEMAFQQHVAAYLERVHKFGKLEQADITGAQHCIAEDHLWDFLTVTQSETVQKLKDDYGTDSRQEIFKALRNELQRTPLWILFRQGLKVRSLEFRLFYPKPRSAASASADKYADNRITFRPHFYFGDTSKEIDFVFFLNGLPIVVLELKHEANQNVHDAVAQYTRRDHSHRIFQHPFLYLAADTAEVKAATDPSREENFRWHNTGLTNKPTNDNEYPVEFLYRDVLSQDHLLEALSFFLIRVPEREAVDDKPASPAFTIFPRYHQSRLVRRLADDITAHYATTGNIGKKYLVEHSAGSGKTLSMCWLAERLHSLFKPGTNEKLVDITFILTDRRSLNKNVVDDIQNFTHLKDVVGIARKADHLPRFLRERKPIIVTTLHKFREVLSELRANPDLKSLRVAFLIDEAHRSQEGSLGSAIRVPFRKPNEPDEDTPELTPEEQLTKVIREFDPRQLFVAFTATPSTATVDLFGRAFDQYTEAEAIAENYIVDVATSIISYKTLYNLRLPIIPDLDSQAVYSQGVVAQALRNVAFQDDELIQYKSEVMLRIFEEQVKSLINGRAKAMIVASSRVAGLKYYNVIKEKLRERGAGYKVLYAFSDFVHPETGKEIHEHAVNELNDGELIEDRFEGDDYRIMVVASKFQTGFDQPLLAGMFLDKPVSDRNAVQTVSRLNRCHDGKSTVVVVDFTNNATKILQAFAKYRQGVQIAQNEPDEHLLLNQYKEILDAGVFTSSDAADLIEKSKTGTDAQLQFFINALRQRFLDRLPDLDDRKSFAYRLSKFVRTFHFLSCFFTFSDEIRRFATFADVVGPQLIKEGTLSELMKQIRATEVTKAAVIYAGVMTTSSKPTLRPGRGKGGAGTPPAKITVQDMIDQLTARFQISEEEALYIRRVTEEKIADTAIRTTVLAHRDDRNFLDDDYRGQVHDGIQQSYQDHGRDRELRDQKYYETGGIFDIMAITVIQAHLTS
jgi:type I restriction enzyme R subunit